MLANLATALFEHGRITTTEAKAKRLRPLAERLITFAKRGDLHARRRVLTVVRDKGVVHELFTEIGPRYENRHGGYTRITKVGPRKGDNAPMAVIELVEALTAKAETVREAEAATKRTAKKAPAKKAAAKKATAAAAAQPKQQPRKQPTTPPRVTSRVPRKPPQRRTRRPSRQRRSLRRATTLPSKRPPARRRHSRRSPTKLLRKLLRA